MQKVIKYLSSPSTRIAFAIFLFSLWWIYATLNHRITALEESYDKIDVVEIQTTLSQIQTDISWIKYNMQK